LRWTAKRLIVRLWGGKKSVLFGEREHRPKGTGPAERSRLAKANDLPKKKKGKKRGLAKLKRTEKSIG